METMKTPVILTSGAVTEIKKMINPEEFDDDMFLRIGVKGGGCSGMTYVLEFDQKKENDQEFETQGIRCVRDKSHQMYLRGMQISWQDGLINRGFAYINPNACTSCGCGTSFAV